MKTGHFESGIAHGAAIADQMRDEPTQREPATFHRHAGGQRLVSVQDRPRTGGVHRETIGHYLHPTAADSKPAIPPTGSAEASDSKSAIVPAGSKAGRTSQCAPWEQAITDLRCSIRLGYFWNS